MLWIAFTPTPAATPTPATESGDAATAAANTTEPVWVDAQPRRAATWWALQYSPRVCWLDDALLLEAGASQRLFGGQQALLQRLAAQAPQWGLAAMAVAPTGLAARAVLHRCPMGLANANAIEASKPLVPTTIPLASLARMLDALPLDTLAAARPVLGLLQRLGCRTLGQLRRLPRAGLARRFGPELLSSLDRAYGQQAERYAWETLPEGFAERIEWNGRIEHAAGLAFAAHRLLRTLQAWLQARHGGVSALRLVWEYDRRRAHLAAHGTLECRLASPSRDAQHLGRLLAEHLGRATLEAPVTALRLEATEVRPLPGISASLLPDAPPPDSERLPQLLERLAARLGPQQVLQGRPLDDHRPDHVQAWQPWKAANANSATSRRSLAGGRTADVPARTDRPARARGQAPGKAADPVGAWLPPWLLDTPLALGDSPHYQGTLTLLAGPHRIAPGWWDSASSAPLRDYFVADSPGAGLVWVSREPGPAGVQWWLHGVYG